MNERDSSRLRDMLREAQQHRSLPKVNPWLIFIRMMYCPMRLYVP